MLTEKQPHFSPLKSPAENSLLRWEWVQVFRKAFEKEGTLESLLAYQSAMKEFTEGFPRG